MEREPTASNWVNHIIVQEEIDKYLVKGKNFINPQEIFSKLAKNSRPPRRR